MTNNGRALAFVVCLLLPGFIESNHVNGNWANWGTWSSCSQTCNPVTRTRTRTCSNPAPANGGRGCRGASQETQICNPQICPIDGNWANWATWSSCTKTCDTGTQTRTRTCSNPAPANGGVGCSGASQETQNCNTQNCPIDGNWANWATWSSCTKTCDTGTQTRTRTCSNPAPANGGVGCSGASQETQNCNTQNCPIDGNWANWGTWSSCTTTCDTGTQTRTRPCSNPAPAHGGVGCIGASQETQICNTQNCPIDGNWANWGTWSSCTKTCDTGTQTRTRACSNPAPANGGVGCSGASQETQNCNRQNCPINGNWANWGTWSSCTKTCDTGTQTRTRTCSNPAPAHGGVGCSGASQGTQNCNTQNCPIDGNWNLWNAWSACGVTCSDTPVVRSRERSCTNPIPQYNGADCNGDAAEAETCDLNSCPIPANNNNNNNLRFLNALFLLGIVLTVTGMYGAGYAVGLWGYGYGGLGFGFDGIL